MEKNMQRQRGFTLLEIMVVIVILGILASLVVPNLMGNKKKRTARRWSAIWWRSRALDM
jgi:prepilin-type N-terminal cleavage/methylation domain-containing protein